MLSRTQRAAVGAPVHPQVPWPTALPSSLNRNLGISFRVFQPWASNGPSVCLQSTCNGPQKRPGGEIHFSVAAFCRMKQSVQGAQGDNGPGGALTMKDIEDPSQKESRGMEGQQTSSAKVPQHGCWCRWTALCLNPFILGWAWSVIQPPSLRSVTTSEVWLIQKSSLGLWTF